MTHTIRAQRGFSMVALLVVLVAGMMATGWEIGRMFDRAQITKAETQGELLGGTLNASMGTYLTTYYTELVNDTAIAGVASRYAPTIAELRTLGILESGFSATNMYGGGYGLSVSRVPTGCVPPACDLTSLVWITAPVTESGGLTNMAYAASAAAKIGANGAFSTLGTPATLSGFNGSWAIGNPVPGTPSGIVAARNGYGAQGFSQFLRRDGTLPMTGNLDMGGQALTNLVSAAAGAACATAGDLARGASGEVLSCQSGTWNSQGSRFWRDPVASFASLPACAAGNAGETRVVMGYATAPKQRLFSCDGTAWVATAVDDNGLMTAGKYMVNDVVTEGTACSPNGLVAKDATGLLLSCQSGSWKKASGGGAGVVTSFGDTFGSMYTSNHQWGEYLYIDPAANLYRCLGGTCNYKCALKGTAYCDDGWGMAYYVTVTGINESTANCGTYFSYPWCPTKGVACLTGKAVVAGNISNC